MTTNQEIQADGEPTFEVIWADRYVHPTVERVVSRHSNYGAAQVRCQQLVDELLNGFVTAGHGSKSALDQFLCMVEQPGIRPHPPNERFFPEAYAERRVAELMRGDWAAVLQTIRAKEPEPQRGWFRWLHHRYLSRYNAHVDIDLRLEWQCVQAAVLDDPERLDAVLMNDISNHAWEIGFLALTGLAAAAWPQLRPCDRGRLVAGLSKSKTEGVWLDAHIADAELSSEDLAEIGCNAIRRQNFLLLERVLNQDITKLQATIERMEPFTRERGPGSWAKQLARLSHRVLDMLLEAAVLLGWTEGARVVLARGANPSLLVWALERSYSAWFSAVSHSIDEGHGELVNVLIAAEADVRGHELEGRNKPLFLAVQTRHWNLVERLLAGGAAFSGGLAYDEKRDFHGRSSADQGKAVKTKLDGIAHLSAQEETASFFIAHGQGGSWTTFLGTLLANDDLDAMRRFEGHGLNTRPTVAEVCRAISRKAWRCLGYLLMRADVPATVAAAFIAEYQAEVERKAAIHLRQHEETMEALRNYKP